MIQFEEQQKLDVISASSSIEQIYISIEEVSATILDLSSNTQSSLEDLSKGILSLEGIKGILKETNQGNECVKSNVNECLIIIA